MLHNIEGATFATAELADDDEDFVRITRSFRNKMNFIRQRHSFNLAWY